MDQIITELSRLFSPKTIAAQIAAALPKVIVATVILVFFLVVWLLARRALTYVLKQAEVDETAQAFLVTVFKYALGTIALIMALDQLGVDIGSILASLGVVGLTIGFAARDTLSNIISGVFIFWDRPFTLQDLVEINGQYGKVESITIRSTRVVTVDGKMLAIPNTVVVNSMVTSYTNFPNLRIDVNVTVAVTENLGNARRVLLDAIKEDGRFMPAPEPQVVVTALNDYNVELQVRAWLEDERQHVAMRFQLRELIFNALNEAGVEMPYETIQLAPVEVKGSLKGGGEAA